jgi:hypothetical protein
MWKEVNPLPVTMLLGMAAGVRLSMAQPDAPARVYSSVPEIWSGPCLEQRQWHDKDDLPQRLELRRRQSDGVHHYVHRATVAVCGDAGKAASCKLHEFRAYYDEIGRFLGYRVPPRKPFTKKEHDPFRSADYARLDKIPRDPDHPLGTLGSIRANVDAVTGATAQYIADRTAQGYAPEQVDAWLREDLMNCNERASRLTVPLLNYLSRAAPPADPAWQPVLRAVAQKTASTYVRKKAKKLLAAVVAKTGAE